MRLYKITNEVNGKEYIGITRLRLRSRWAKHVYDAKNRTRPTSILQKAIRKYGRDAFTMVELGTADTWEDLCQMEVAAIIAHGTRSPAGYNMTDGGEGCANPVYKPRRVPLNFTPEVREKLRLAHLGVKLAAEHAANIGAANRGKVRTDEHKRAYRAGKLGARNPQHGKPRTADQRAKIAAGLTGYKHTPDFCRKAREAKRAAPPSATLTPDQVRAIRARLADKVMGKLIAQEFGITAQTVCDIKKGRSWTHVL